MRKLLLIIGFVFSVSCILAQEIEPTQKISGTDMVSFASEAIIRKYVGPPGSTLLKSAESTKTSFLVKTVNLPDEAVYALNYAISVWDSLLLSAVPVHVTFKMESLGANVVAKSRPASFFMNFEGALLQNVYYPVALAEKLSGYEMNPNSADIICRFNQNLPWYFGTDGNTPANQYDFVTAVLHELAHGLGFSGFFKDDGRKGYLNNGNNFPGVFDFYVYNSNNQQLVDPDLFPSPSSQLHKELVSGKLKFVLPAENEEDIRIVSLYSPTAWDDAASIYHLTDEMSLMAPAAAKGFAVHRPDAEVLSILKEIGWNALVFDFEPLKDIEEPQFSIPLEIKVLAEENLKDLMVSIFFSADNFNTTQSVELSHLALTNRFQGAVPLEFSTGKIDYYFEAKLKNGRIYRFPTVAPQKNFSFTVGPDYVPPTIAHNPQKIVSLNSAFLTLNVLASDNIGIKNVEVEYRVNGTLQPPAKLKLTGRDFYSLTLQLEPKEFKNVELEYRIKAEDKSVNGNKKYLPATGFYPVQLFQPLDAVESYSTDFEEEFSDFVGADFYVSGQTGFSGNILHTAHPYPVSAFKNEKYNLIAQLKYPVILQEGGKMRFDEVVLVEPGENNTDFSEELHWDFVAVEGSKDGGLTWSPFVPSYDSGIRDFWREAYLGGTANNTSKTAGNESMFRENVIVLTENTGFFAGDTVLFRFRLASDYTMNGWGWAIDNIDIQANLEKEEEPVVRNTVQVFPNPFYGKFYVDLSSFGDIGQIDVFVTDLFGKAVFKKSGITATVSPQSFEINDVSNGIYLIKVTAEGKELVTQKLIKM